MKNSQLPTDVICAKLKAVSFSKPSTNLAAFLFAESCDKSYAFVEQERVKLVKKYGVEKDGKISVPQSKLEEFQKGMLELLEQDTAHEITKNKLTDSDFEDDCCQYPQEKEMWLTGAEIQKILNCK